MSLEIPFGLKRLTSGPDSEWTGPYESVAAANAAVPEAVREKRTVIIVDTEYWWKNGTGDDDLIQKTPGLNYSTPSDKFRLTQQFFVDVLSPDKLSEDIGTLAGLLVFSGEEIVKDRLKTNGFVDVFQTINDEVNGILEEWFIFDADEIQGIKCEPCIFRMYYELNNGIGQFEKFSFDSENYTGEVFPDATDGRFTNAIRVGDNLYIFANSSQLYKFDVVNKTSSKISLLGSIIGNFILTSDESSIVFTHSTGIGVLNLETEEQTYFSAHNSEENYTGDLIYLLSTSFLIEANDGNFYFGGNSGLNCFNPSTNVNTRINNSTANYTGDAPGTSTFKVAVEHGDYIYIGLLTGKIWKYNYVTNHGELLDEVYDLFSFMGTVQKRGDNLYILGDNGKALLIFNLTTDTGTQHTFSAFNSVAIDRFLEPKESLFLDITSDDFVIRVISGGRFAQGIVKLLLPQFPLSSVKFDNIDGFQLTSPEAFLGRPNSPITFNFLENYFKIYGYKQQKFLGFNLLLPEAWNEIGALATESNEITFDRLRSYGVEAALTGPLTVSVVNGKRISQTIRHNDDEEPAWPSEFKRLNGSYVTNVDNFIICEYFNSTTILYTISQVQS